MVVANGSGLGERRAFVIVVRLSKDLIMRISVCMLFLGRFFLHLSEFMIKECFSSDEQDRLLQSVGKDALM